MAASQRSQQEAFHKLTGASKDKVNDAMFTSIKTYDGKNRQAFEDWIDKINQACRVSGCNFRTEIIKKSTGVVCQVVMACDNYSDNQLLAKLRNSFSDAPTMNQAWEKLRNLRQGEYESIAVYAYKWGWALVRSSGICPEDKRHPHVIKDFISTLRRNIRNKIANKWAEMRNQPHTIQEAFVLADEIEIQIQVADSFKLELMNDFTQVEVNEISTDETSGEEYEVNEVYCGNKWGNNRYRKPKYMNNWNFSSRPHQNTRVQDSKPGRRWDQKEKDSKITLTQESSHFVPSKFSDSLNSLI